MRSRSMMAAMQTMRMETKIPATNGIDASGYMNVAQINRVPRQCCSFARRSIISVRHKFVKRCGALQMTKKEVTLLWTIRQLHCVENKGM